MIPQEVRHEFHGFLFSEHRYRRKKFRLRSLVGNGNLLLETSLSILTKVCRVCLKKYWKNFVNFAILSCILWFVSHVSKAAHFSLSSSYSIFPVLSISIWGNDIR